MAENGTRINAAEAVKTGILHWKEAGLPYIWGNLDDKWNLKDKAVLAAIGVFGTFVIYSLFQVSVRKECHSTVSCRHWGWSQNVRLVC